MMNNVKKTFLITGATKGIGFAVTEYLREQGHSIVGIARNKPESPFPGNFYILDLNDEKATEDLFQEINNKYLIDGIINNVGIALREPLGEIKIADLRSVLDLNLRPALQAAQIFMKGMINRKYGRIVNIASRAVLGVANASIYAAAKAGLIAFSKSWAFELAPFGITVNAVAPGPTETEHFRKGTPAPRQRSHSRVFIDLLVTGPTVSCPKNASIGAFQNSWTSSESDFFDFTARGTFTGLQPFDFFSTNQPSLAGSLINSFSITIPS
jgi:NAD(P)-dependent dehydrogenase (short-subunit alcohol dehydrogenase family)